jgi:hypothetical protein
MNNIGNENFSHAFPNRASKKNHIIGELARHNSKKILSLDNSTDLVSKQSLLSILSAASDIEYHGFIGPPCIAEICSRYFGPNSSK